MEGGAEQFLRVDEPVGAFPRRRQDRVPSVLVVDDEEDFLELTELFLEADGIRIMKARSASEALWHALRTPPDIVFLDLMLPGADGFQVLRALRSEPETRDIPVFACSAADIGDGHRILRAGFDGHFPKPVNWPRLRQVLRRLLGS
ncbi:MAG: response regulator [Deltaproteobacteria bacterium]|nr:response regulator [Deltaproteobacteria bacterium]